MSLGHPITRHVLSNLWARVHALPSVWDTPSFLVTYYSFI